MFVAPYCWMWQHSTFFVSVSNAHATKGQWSILCGGSPQYSISQLPAWWSHLVTSITTTHFNKQIVKLIQCYSSSEDWIDKLKFNESALVATSSALCYKWSITNVITCTCAGQFFNLIILCQRLKVSRERVCKRLRQLKFDCELKSFSAAAKLSHLWFRCPWAPYAEKVQKWPLSCWCSRVCQWCWFSVCCGHTPRVR